MNFTSLIQPMDQGVILSLKQSYRKLFTTEALTKMENKDIDVINAIKKDKLKDVIFIVYNCY